jgi:hypothetical protein
MSGMLGRSHTSACVVAAQNANAPTKWTELLPIVSSLAQTSILWAPDYRPLALFQAQMERFFEPASLD